MIRPMWDSLSDITLLGALTGATTNEYAAVRQTWRSRGVFQFDDTWKDWLHRGLVDSRSAAKSLSVRYSSARANKLLSHNYLTPKKDEITLEVGPSYAMYDGRYLNNGWLQETPDPITKLTWGNALLLNHEIAERLKLKKMILFR